MDGDVHLLADPTYLKKWLSRHAEISAQNPWFLAKENPGAQVIVKETPASPVMLLEQYRECAGGLQIEPLLIRPDLVDVKQASRSIGIDPAYLGFYFCPPDAIPPEFKNHSTYTFRQAVQYVGDFDATLYGPENRHLRQNLARGEKYGLVFEPHMIYRKKEISDVVIAWVEHKHFSLANLPAMERAFKNANRIANVATSPFGTLYGVRNGDGQLRALAAVLEMGEYASIECVASYRDVDRAQEYLETNLWREFARTGIRIVDRGSWDKQSPSLKAHKEKFARIHKKEWVCARPPLTRSYEGMQH